MPKQTLRPQPDLPPELLPTSHAEAHPPASHSEDGYILVAVIFMVALVVLSLAIAAPKIASAIQRDRELEMVHRGEQYKRAIRLYYKKFGSYPSSIDQLEKTNNIRFLRKRYLDPLTGKDDWKLIHMGEAHVRPLGFFGQTLGAASSIAGASSVSNGSFTQNSGSSSSGFGSTTGSSGFGSSTGTGGLGTGGLGGGVGSTIPATTLGGCYALAGTSGSSSTGIGTTPIGSNSNSSSSTTGSDSSSSSGSSGFGSTSSSGFGSTGGSTSLGSGTTGSSGLTASTTLGGAPVCGVMPPQTKATILQYKLKTHYNEWEFVYDPVEEQQAASSLLGGAGNINGTGNSINGTGSSSSGGGFGGTSGNTFGSQGSSGFGSGSTTGTSFGSSPGSSTNPGQSDPPQ